MKHILPVASWLDDEAKNMGGLQAGSDWDAYTDAQWESWNGWQLKISCDGDV